MTTRRLPVKTEYVEFTSGWGWRLRQEVKDWCNEQSITLNLLVEQEIIADQFQKPSEYEVIKGEWSGGYNETETTIVCQYYFTRHTFFIDFSSDALFLAFKMRWS